MNWITPYRRAIIYFSLFALIICSLPILFTKSYLFSQLVGTLDYANHGHNMGDTIGGIMGPFVGLLAGFLTFLAFWAQFEANNQAKSTNAISACEDQFYTMLELHRKNVEEMAILDRIIGRKCFINMTFELKALHFSLVKVNESRSRLGKGIIDKRRLLEISYLILFFGSQEEGPKYLAQIVNDQELDFVNDAEKELERVRKIYLKRRDKAKEFDMYFALPNGDQKFKFKMKYMPFWGHGNKLGHYFRHLYQLFDLITTTKVFGSENDSNSIARKNQYVKTLRAQLSNHEQVLLFYNCLTSMGYRWTHGFDKTIAPRLYEFNFIKNIPFPLLELGFTIEDHLREFWTDEAIIQKKILEFEWLELIENSPVIRKSRSWTSYSVSFPLLKK